LPGPSAYDKYKQEIGALSQKAVTLRTIPGAEGDEPYVLALENTVSYNAAVTDLQNRINGDASVATQKAELLAALQQESATRGPYYLAPELNKKPRELVIQKFALYGKDAFDKPGVIPVILAFRGEQGLREIRSAPSGSSTSTAQSVLYAQSHVMQ